MHWDEEANREKKHQVALGTAEVSPSNSLDQSTPGNITQEQLIATLMAGVGAMCMHSRCESAHVCEMVELCLRLR